ncbi:MAG TPA: acyltransferase [Terracidiphilus sp.]|jgi:peptidoglycan/LPS O-acetylase OafA/YrhL
MPQDQEPGNDNPVPGAAPIRPENRLFYPALDGMRAIAFLMVFGQHYLHIPWGWTGVDLFFVLSGFLITGILFDSRNDAHRVRNFYVRRTLRIFPLYYGVMLALVLLEPFVHWQWNWHWIAWPAYVGNFARFIHPYLPGAPLQRLADFQPTTGGPPGRVPFYLGHFWSLCVEEQFYLIWPWLVFSIRNRRTLAWVCAATVPVCLAMRLAGQHVLPPWMLDNEVLYRATPFRLDALLIGGLVALLLRGPRGRNLLRAARIGFPIAMGAMVLWVLFSPTGHLWHHPYLYPNWKFTWGLSAVDLLSALLILEAIQPHTVVFKVLCIRPLRWIGRISYGAYVLHDIPHPLYAACAQRGVSLFAVHFHMSRVAIGAEAMLASAILGLACTLMLAWLSYRFFESPFLNLKERWTLRAGVGR